jgi:hypothetical protein
MNGIGAAAFTTSTTIPTFASFQFSVNSLSDNAEYLGLFDQYRIDQVEIYLEPTNAQGTTVFGDLVTAVDLDDASTPTSVIGLAGKQGSLCGLGASGRHHVWQPHIALAAYGSSVFASFSNVPATWIDSGSPAVQHYGFKVAADPTPAVVTYNIYTRALVSFRAPGI